MKPGVIIFEKGAMTIAKIIWIYHDQWLDENDKERLKAEAGEAFAEFCTGFRDLKSHKVLYTNNIVNLCDEVHSTE